jgi:hypothetical protein
MDDQDLTGRGARQVFDDHLELRKRGDLEQDLARNYAPDVVVLTARGVLRGHDGVRESAALLYQAIRNANRYEYENAQCEDRVALLEWRAEGRTSAIRDGVDSYLIERGRIVAQTIHYTVVSRELSVTDLAGGARSAADGRPTGETG